MARERLYGWNGELPAKSVSGQKQIVLQGMKNDPKAMRTGKQWATIIGPELKTRQDAYRVVLYYILILKNEGCVGTREFDIDATTKTETGKHAIVVKSAAHVEERTAEHVEAQLDTIGAA